MDRGSEFAWIASYLHGQRRQYSKTGAQARSRCFLAREPWFDARLSSHGYEYAESRCGRCSLHVCGLVKFAEPQRWALFESWSAEAKLLWVYMGRPRDAFLLPIVRVWPCAEPKQVLFRRRSGRDVRQRGYGDFAKVNLKSGIFWNIDSMQGYDLVSQGGGL